MNPFDLKAALVAKHAQHPVIIHFPIALFIISVAFDLLAIWKRLKGNLLLPLLFALAASGMIWLLSGWRISQRKLPQWTPGVSYILLALATVLLIAIAGHLGGSVRGVESGAI